MNFWKSMMGRLVSRFIMRVPDEQALIDHLQFFHLSTNALFCVMIIKV